MFYLGTHQGKKRKREKKKGPMESGSFDQTALSTCKSILDKVTWRAECLSHSHWWFLVTGSSFNYSCFCALFQNLDISDVGTALESVENEVLESVEWRMLQGERETASSLTPLNILFIMSFTFSDSATPSGPWRGKRSWRSWSCEGHSKMHTTFFFFQECSGSPLITANFVSLLKRVVDKC